MKAIKYIRIFCFSLCAYVVFGLLNNQDSIESPVRWFHYFPYDLMFLRNIIDVFILISLLVICLKDWMNQDKRYYWACVIFFLFFNFLDTFSWLNETFFSPVFYTTPLFVYSLPVLVIIQDILYQKKVNYKYPMFAGLTLLLIGFLFYYFFLINVYPTDELFEVYVRNTIIRNWIVYVGYMLSVSGIILKFFNPNTSKITSQKS